SGTGTGGASPSEDASVTGSEAHTGNATDASLAPASIEWILNVRATAVSGDGLTVVGSDMSAPKGAAFRWARASGVEDLPGEGGSARGVNADGSRVIGSVTTPISFAANAVHAALWTTAPSAVSYPLDTMAFGTAISADGQMLVGNLLNRDPTHA